MSHPDTGPLVDLVLGEPVEPNLAEHIRGCFQCLQEVQALRDTVDLTRRAVIEPVSWHQPPAELWSRIETALDDEAGQDGGPDDITGPPTSSTAPESAVTDRPGVVELDRARRRRSGGRSRWSTASRSGIWLVGVAAASALVGLFAGRAVWGSSPQEAVTVATTGLQRLDSTQVVGAAAVRRESGHLDLDLDLALSADQLPVAGRSYLEVWLINRDGRRMVSIGVLDAPSSSAATPVDVPATFPIAQSLLDAGYVVVDVSSEPLDDDPTHSGDSLARGTLAV